jgi:Right handed beta helix region
MIRIMAKLFVATVALTVFWQAAPLSAEPFTWVSSTGNSSGTCPITQPCTTLATAMANTDAGGQVNCLNSPGIFEGTIFGFTASLTIDCVGVHTGFGSIPQIGLSGTGQVFKVRNLTISGVGTNGGSTTTTTAIKLTGSGTLILENCVFENFNASGAGPALDIEPNGPLNLVIKNSRISNNTAAGVLIKPASGGSVTATFEGVTITKNAGGLRTDTTNGAVRLDISNSTISNNANNGLIAIGGAGGQNMVSVGSGVIASNSQAGIEASGANAAVLVNNTLLDSNAGGAISAVSGGRILTYQNNRTIGSPGTGFTGTASPQ